MWVRPLSLRSSSSLKHAEAEYTDETPSARAISSLNISLPTNNSDDAISILERYFKSYMGRQATESSCSSSLVGGEKAETDPEIPFKADY